MANSTEQAATVLQRFGQELHLMRPLLPTYVHLLISAVFPIWTAAHAALARPYSAVPEEKAAKTAVEESDDEQVEPTVKLETLGPSDAIVFPLLAGCTLASLYFIITYLKDPAWLNWCLGIYFAGVGFFFMVRFLKDGLTVVRSVLFPLQYSYQSHVWSASKTVNQYQTITHSSDHALTTKAALPKPLGSLSKPVRLNSILWTVRNVLYKKAKLEAKVHKLIQIKTSIDILDVGSFGVSVIAVGYHTFVGKPWFLTNLLGFSFCYGSLQFVSPGTATTGTLILCALFFYDIYFVFFTPMMVTVATKLDVPIKLLFPRPDGCVLDLNNPDRSAALELYRQCLAKKRSMAMLGLGDIVVPGMILAFALRFDLYLYYLKQKQVLQPEGSIVTDDSESKKPVYQSATGSWGERFWTARRLWSTRLQSKTFPKTYFYATIIGYLVGMVTTVVVMQVFQHAQPALLYLVPGVLCSLWGTALAKGDIKHLWQYTEMPDEEGPKDLTDGKKDTKDGRTKTEKQKKIDGDDKEEENKVEKKDTLESHSEIGIENGNDNSIDTNTDTNPAPQSLQTTKSTDKHLVYFTITLPDQKPKSKSTSSTPAPTKTKPEGKIEASESEG